MKQSEKNPPVFTPPWEGYSPCLASTSKYATRNTAPVMKEADNIDATFKQEVHNPSVRDRKYPDSKALDEELYTDLVLQLNAAQKAAIHFENEARELAGTVDRITERYGKLVGENEVLKADNDRLRETGFWRRLGKKLSGKRCETFNGEYDPYHE